ncbi:putative Reverse transcriptase [Seiridium unicorne]|uniref:Reverse transcriptase n=1 Tax=Seiridium unicorne TaxID=138068 RepID=A0ABR2UNA5_9PEZI
MKGAEPPIFRGEATSPRARQEDYTNWRSLLRVKLAFDRHAFATPLSRLLYAAQFLSGDAYSRIRTAIDDIAANSEHPEDWACGWRDVGDLFQYLDPVYIVVDVFAQACRDFEALQQRGANFADFIASFQRLADESRQTNHARVENLRRKVSRELQNALVSVVLRPGPDDITGWIQLFRTLSNNIADNDFRKAQHSSANPRHLPRHNALPPNQSANGLGTTSEGDPMQLDAMTSRPRSRITDQERKRRRDGNLCLPWLRQHNPSIDWKNGIIRIGGVEVAETRRTEPLTVPPPNTKTPPPAKETVNIRALAAPTFLLMAKQKGVVVDKMPLAKLYALTDMLRAYPELQAYESPEEIASQTPSSTLRKILVGDAEEGVGEIPVRLQAFKEWIDEAPWLRRVSEDDIAKYLDGKPQPTPAEIQATLPDWLRHMWEAWNPKRADQLPPHRPWDHKIELLPGETPPYHRPRPMSPPELLAIRKYLDEHLSKGFIRASTSQAAAPVLLAKKPGGGIRICVDYRGLNNVTVKNRYPIPLIRETLDALCQAKYFTKLDITAAFNNLRIAPGDEWKTAFITRFGLYECLVANFGMTGAPSSFQHYVNHALFDVLDKYATAYLDDILIYSGSKKEHRRHVTDVVQRLMNAGLTMDIHKCEFEVTETKYLGLIISTSGIKMDPGKVSAITEWESPTTLKDLQRFIGFANYYRRFIKGFSSIARPLTILMSQSKWPGTLTSDAESAFQRLKNAFMTAPVLAYYDPRRLTTLEVDASDWASGGVLSQQGEDGVTHPVAFFSSKHTPAECNYEIYDKELLAIVKAFEEWRPELQGTEQPVEVITDHKNLQHFATTKLLNQRQVRWSEFLSDFRFKIVYRPGKHAVVPDALSRLPGVAPANKTDLGDDRVANRSRTLLPPDRWAALCSLDVSEPIDALIQRAYDSSVLAKRILRSLVEEPAARFPAAIRRQFRTAKADCKAIGGRIYVLDRLFIPPDEELRLQVLHRSHSLGPAGHPGRYKTYDLLRRTYFWPRLSRDVAAFVKGCHMCQRTKTSRVAPPGFLSPLPVPFRPWSDLSVDYVGPLPDCERNGVTYKHALVVVDRLTKMRHFIPVPDGSAVTLADAFVTGVYRLHGTPATIISDRGTQFVSTFWKELSRRLGVTLQASTTAHPETDGQTEIVNAGMEQYLRAYCTFFQDDWVDWLPLAEFATNNQTSESTGFSPFFANYGWNPTMGSEPVRPSDAPKTALQQQEFHNATTVADRMDRILTVVKAFLADTQERQSHFANAHRSDADMPSVGDQVWVSTRNMNTGRPLPKLSDKWIGPLPVLRVYRRAVAVELPPAYKLFPVFHVSLVRRYEGGYPGQSAVNEAFDKRAEGVEVTNEGPQEPGEEEWHFEKILNSRQGSNGLEYRIKWPYPHKPTWEPAEYLEGCDDAIRDFHRASPTKLGPPAWFQQGDDQETPVPRRRSTRVQARVAGSQ